MLNFGPPAAVQFLQPNSGYVLSAKRRWSGVTTEYIIEGRMRFFKWKQASHAGIWPEAYENKDLRLDLDFSDVRFDIHDSYNEFWPSKFLQQ